MPVFQTNEAEVVDLDDLEPLWEGVEDELDPVLRKPDAQVEGQRIPVAVGDLHPFDGAHLVLDWCDTLAEVCACKKNKK